MAPVTLSYAPPTRPSTAPPTVTPWRVASAIARAKQVQARSVEVVEEARRLRGGRRECRWFRVAGDLEGEHTRVWWWRGRISCSNALRDRADVIVAMGDEFRAGDVTVRASLDEGVPAALTFIRALDRVTSVDLGLP